MGSRDGSAECVQLHLYFIHDCGACEIPPPDLLSAKIAQTYNRSDVVNTDHLKEVLHAMLRLLFIMVR